MKDLRKELLPFPINPSLFASITATYWMVNAFYLFLNGKHSIFLKDCKMIISFRNFSVISTVMISICVLFKSQAKKESTELHMYLFVKCPDFVPFHVHNRT
jgi:hypothetical protein